MRSFVSLLTSKFISEMRLATSRAIRRSSMVAGRSSRLGGAAVAVVKPVRHRWI
jgi:hypothetical protein